MPRCALRCWMVQGPSRCSPGQRRSSRLAWLCCAFAALLPSGKKLSPKQRQTVVHYRSEAVKDYVRRRAEGICEGCRQTAPFLNRKRQPYLEPHHTTRRADGGPDHPAHVIALCPTCHRRVHHGYDGEVYNRELIDRLPAIEEEAAAMPTVTETQ